MQPEQERALIASMGRALGPDVLARVQDLYRIGQDRLAADRPVAAADLAYGPHPRQRLDLYEPDIGTPAPVLLWVHGGGFVRGEKSSPDHPFNAHVGRWAARHGMLGAVMNYRFAPEATWPAGGDDVALAVDRLRADAARHGGDPERIVLAGTSAGSTHVATALARRPDLPVRGAVLLSGLYGFTGLEERDTLYFGPADRHAERMPRDAVAGTDLPLLLACAEFDPPRFQAETLGLLQARLARHGAMPRAHVAGGHNHFSLACHIGGEDTRLSDEILTFVREVCQEDTRP